MPLLYGVYTFLALMCITLNIQSAESLQATLQKAITNGDTQTILQSIKTPADTIIMFDNTKDPHLPKSLPLLLYLWQNRFKFTTQDLTKILEVIVPKNSSILTQKFNNNDTIFHILARNSNDYHTQPFFKELMEQSSVDTYNKINNSNQTPLTIAIQAKNNQILNVLLLTLTRDKWERILSTQKILTQALQAENLEALYILLMAGISPTENDKKILTSKRFTDDYVRIAAKTLFDSFAKKQTLIFPLELFSIKGLQPITIVYALENNGFILFNNDDKRTPLIYGDIPGNNTIGPRTVAVNEEKYKNMHFLKNSQKTLPARILEEFPAEKRVIQALQEQKLLNTATLQPQDIATYFSQAEPQAVQELLKNIENLPKNKAYINENLFNMDFTGSESNAQREEKAILLLQQGITPSADTIKKLLENQSENSTLGALLFEKAQTEVQKQVANEELLQMLLTKTDTNPHNLKVILAHMPPAQRNEILTADVIKNALKPTNAAVSATLFEYAQHSVQQELLQELPALINTPAFDKTRDALLQSYNHTLLKNLGTNLALIAFIAL